MPEARQDLYGKSSTDLVGEDLRLFVKDEDPATDVTVLGTIKYVENYDGFAPDAEGNFFPFTLGDKAKGTTMTFEKNGQPTGITNADWEANNVLKVEKNQVWDIKVDGELKVRFKFNEATLQAKAVG